MGAELEQVKAALLAEVKRAGREGGDEMAELIWDNRKGIGKAGFILFLLAGCPALPMAWCLFKGTALVFPENASLFRNAGKILCVVLVLGLICSGISRLGEGQRIAAAEQLIQSQNRKAHEAIALNRVILDSVSSYPDSGALKTDSAKKAAERQILLANEMLRNSSVLKSRSWSRERLQKRYEIVVAQNSVLCREMERIRDSAKQMIAQL